MLPEISTREFARYALEKAGLSPYRHEIDRRGDQCVSDCPACKWAERKKPAKVAIPVVYREIQPEMRA